jgi:hypothetical protein
MEKYFFDTFGYITTNSNVDKNSIIDAYEYDITSKMNLPPLNGAPSRVGENNRYPNLRFDAFTSDIIYSVFYNNSFLDKIYEITNDFVVLSPMESFQLTRTGIHRDLASELKQIKVLFYLDDVNSYEKGPLYVIPGTHNIYDKYSSSIADNVGWPAPEKGPGGNFLNDMSYLDKNVPKTYFYSNADKIILFNLNLLHGSDGNVIDPSILRRCIGMTLMCVDRSNETLMTKIDNFFAAYNVNNLNIPAYEYCKKNNLTSWLKHFYFPTHLNDSFSHSADGTDANARELSKSHNRWTSYLDIFLSPRFKNRNNLLNCFDDEVKNISVLSNPHDYLGI